MGNRGSLFVAENSIHKVFIIRPQPILPPKHICIYTTDFQNEFISFTDIAKYKNADDPRFAIQNWMRNRNAIAYLGVWEELHNPDFNRVRFEAVTQKKTRNCSTISL